MVYGKLLRIIAFAISLGTAYSVLAASSKKDIELGTGQKRELVVNGAKVGLQFFKVESDDRCLLRGEVDGFCKGQFKDGKFFGVKVSAALIHGKVLFPITLSMVSEGATALPGIRNCAQSDGFRVWLTNVKPWPRQGKPPKASDYRASFIVEMSNEECPAQ